jgi:sialic acid synthase SpsE
MECFDLPVGYSGHEPGWLIPVAAVAAGSCIIEKHITLSKRLKGGDHCFSLEPDELKQMVKNIRLVEQALGDGKKRLHPQEMPFREKLSKSMVACVPIKKGMPIRYEMLTFKSPGNGIPPNHLEDIILRKAKNNIPLDKIITEDDLDGR